MSVISIRIGRRRHTYRSTQTYASVDADIRNGRRRHPQRSTQTSATVGADARNGRRGCFSHHLTTSTSQHKISTSNLTISPPQHL
ncbi:hypothetical protein [Leyella stercorea]|uniref:hypothetical protein n=1 Tax=Leyella stercorea TaxID=363265 RepID=UPI003AEFC0E6